MLSLLGKAGWKGAFLIAKSTEEAIRADVRSHCRGTDSNYQK